MDVMRGDREREGKRDVELNNLEAQASGLRPPHNLRLRHRHNLRPRPQTLSILTSDTSCIYVWGNERSSW